MCLHTHIFVLVVSRFKIHSKILIFYIFADFDEEDVNLTAILNDLSQIQENINKSHEGNMHKLCASYPIYVICQSCVMFVFQLSQQPR